jgi:hypothetical protein
MSGDSNEEITSGQRPVSVSNDEWNQQTTVDARNVLQTQQSVEPSQLYHTQQSVQSTIDLLFYNILYIDLFLVNKQPNYPNHILHPEVIPSLNDVPDELNKRRNIRFIDPLALENYETEMPMVIASSLQDELQRAVQNRFEEKFSFFFFLSFSFFSCQ